jgi:hypothetical protein
MASQKRKKQQQLEWWFSYGDARVADTWFRECLYFPEDNPTEEERNFYQQILQEFVKKKISYNFHLDSTKKAFWQWYQMKERYKQTTLSIT